MKKILLFVSMIVLMAACNSDADSTNEESVDTLNELTKALNPILEEFPNYTQNKMAKDSVRSRVIDYFDSCVGHEFSVIYNVPLDFFRVGTSKGDSVEVWFKPLVEPGNRDDNLHPDFMVRVYMPNEEALKLSHGIYRVTGTLKEWDAVGKYGFNSLDVSQAMDLGTFIMTNAKVKIYY